MTTRGRLSATFSPCVNEPIYTTTDIYLASFLFYRGMTFIGCERLRPKKVEFRFATGPDLHALLRLFWSGQRTPVVPSELFACLHRLRCLSIERN